MEFVQAHTYQDILFLVGIDYLGVELSMEVRLSILERLKANEGGLEAEELQELGLYTEYRNVAAEMAALLEASYCGSRFEQTLYSIDELRRADRQAEVQMLLRFFENMTIMASVQDYNAAGSAIREKGSTAATLGYESVSGDYQPSKSGISGDYAQEVMDADRVERALNGDVMHRSASYLSKEQIMKGHLYYLRGSDGKEYRLIQVEGGLNDYTGIFEYIMDSSGNITHQRFVIGGIFTGYPNQ